MAEVALRVELLDQLLERQVLMGIGGQRGLPDPREQLRERWSSGCAGEVGAQHQRVDEEPDQPLGPQLAAAGDRRSDAHVVGIADAGQQSLEGGQDGHEQGHPLPARQRLQERQQSGRESQGPARAARARSRRPRAIERQVEHRRRTGQAGPPVGQLGLQHLPTEPAALPDRVVPVLDRELRQGGRAALQAGIVEGAQLPRQHPQRPAVADHVVHGQQEELLRLAQAHQGRAQQRSAGKVEGMQSLRARQPAGLLQAPGGRQAREIDLRQRDRSGRIDHLDRLPQLPSIATNRVRSDSWRRATSPRAAASIARSSRPGRCSAAGML